MWSEDDPRLCKGVFRRTADRPNIFPAPEAYNTPGTEDAEDVLNANAHTGPTAQLDNMYSKLGFAAFASVVFVRLV